MEGEGFLRRWSRLKSGAGDEAPLPGRMPAGSEVGHARSTSDEVAHVRQQKAAGSAAAATDSSIPAIPSARARPTMEDAMHLTPDSDYSAFVAKDVDKAVRRLALKKLFADPHFNQPDGLDIHMADYNIAAPLPATMLAALRQARDFLQEDPASEDNDSAASDSVDERGCTVRAAAGNDAAQSKHSEPGRNES